MCGSGTAAIEAALIAINRAPGSFRDHFAFMSLAGYGDLDDWARIRKGLDRGWYAVEKDFSVTQTDPSAPTLHRVTPSAIWNLMTTDARKQERPADCPVAPIICTDIAQGAIDATRENARAAGVTELIQSSVCDFAATPLPPAPAVLFMNPEYGDRLGDLDELPATYARIGEFLKTSCRGFHIYILSGNTGLSVNLGLKASRVLPCHNGGIDCKLLEFHIFDQMPPTATDGTRQHSTTIDDNQQPAHPL